MRQQKLLRHILEVQNSGGDEVVEEMVMNWLESMDEMARAGLDMAASIELVKWAVKMLRIRVEDTRERRERRLMPSRDHVQSMLGLELRGGTDGASEGRGSSPEPWSEEN